ncbi:hypothetical protein KI387_024629, partial [Taxus chinensis]
TQIWNWALVLHEFADHRLEVDPGQDLLVSIADRLCKSLVHLVSFSRELGSTHYLPPSSIPHEVTTGQQ